MLRTLLKGLIILWWQKYWLLGTVAVVLGGTGAYHLISQPVYESQAVINTGLPPELNDYAEETDALIQRFLIAEGLEDDPALHRLEAGDGRVRLWVRAGAPDEAAVLAEDLARGLLRAFRGHHHGQRTRLEEDLESLDRRISDLRSSLRRLSAERPEEADNLYLATRALVEDSGQARLGRLQAEREALAGQLARLEQPGPGLLRAPEPPRRPSQPDYAQLWRVAGTLAAVLGLLSVVLAQQRTNRQQH
ncbi:hypothetical protein ACN2MM_14715 [Alkalilimnicola ehrlichii MLHE-1]|uniref:Lipopolysaccharide biosynthesis n=1 Tax=Alkalilimnicola ehrlichii (strain ATCC BAA-1101 / DSM 17681 / MLHE-1) TaxID=187272 RepID=Q0A4W4_ALKEH|nr:LPS biosynthesis protein [Alkalilimnicola ehrlichii]ABI58123.1 lipopolysaccharide biosynthesis [Alkalilimnicola ehrlichii MLHE-1]